MKEKATPLGLSFVLAPPSGIGVEVDFGRLLLLDASLCAVAFALSQVKRHHVALAGRVTLWSVAVALVVAVVGMGIVAKRDADRQAARKRRAQWNAERPEERNPAQRVLSDEEALQQLEPLFREQGTPGR